MSPRSGLLRDHSGPFNANLMSAAATVASLEYLKQEPPYERLVRSTANLTQGLKELAEEASIPLRLHTWDFDIVVMPRDWTSLSIRRVETPSR